jgi:hypothetical protein
LAVLSEPYWAEFEDRFGVDVALRRIGYRFLAADGEGIESAVGVYGRVVSEDPV